jgi:Predicted membrane protein (DUF2085)
MTVRRTLRYAFVCAALMWAAALLLATLVASRPHPAPPAYLFSLFVYVAGSVVCHQLPERSFHLWAAQMPVCARCTGIYFGAALAAIILVARRRGPVYVPAVQRAHGASSIAGGTADTRVGHSSSRRWLVVATLPTIITLLYEWTTGHTPANWIRATAGVPIGVIVAWVVVSAANDGVN